MLGKSSCLFIICYSLNTKKHSHFQQQYIFFWASELCLLKSGKTFIHLPPGFNSLDQLLVINLNSSLLLSQNSFAAVWEMNKERHNVQYLDKLEGRTKTGGFKAINFFVLVGGRSASRLW